MTLPVGNNSVSVVAEDFGTTGPGPNGGNTTTKNCTVTVAGGQDRTFTYDDNGNCTRYTTADKTVTYEWDAEDRLVKITQLSTGNPQLTSEFTYDGFSRWVKIEEKTNGVSGSVKRFIWCGTRVCEERDAGNNVTKRFFEEGEEIGGTPFYFTRDHLGSIREMVGQGGTVRARYDYDPYGRRTKLPGAREADFGFTGHYYHAPSGLHLALYRAYDADIGRWINRDPIAEEGGMNLYAYVGNDPIGWIDPLGFGLQPPAAPPANIPVPGDPDARWVQRPARPGGRIPWVPNRPIPGRGQPILSWDPNGHWDLRDGLNHRTHFDRHGNVISAANARSNAHRRPKSGPGSLCVSGALMGAAAGAASGLAASVDNGSYQELLEAAKRGELTDDMMLDFSAGAAVDTGNASAFYSLYGTYFWTKKAKSK